MCAWFFLTKALVCMWAWEQVVQLYWMLLRAMTSSLSLTSLVKPYFSWEVFELFTQNLSWDYKHVVLWVIVISRCRYLWSEGQNLKILSDLVYWKAGCSIHKGDELAQLVRNAPSLKRFLLCFVTSLKHTKISELLRVIVHRYSTFGLFWWE